MINWFSLFANALWIFSLSLALAVLSYTYWEARNIDQKFKHIIKQPAKQTWLNIAGIFFSTGLALSADPTWEKVIWVIMVLLFTLQIGALYYPTKKD